MWPGPYGQGGGARKYVLASLDQSLRRMGTRVRRHLLLAPLRSLTRRWRRRPARSRTAVQQGKALYVGISEYSPEKTLEFAAALRAWNVPLLIHQPSYNIFQRRIENGLVRGLRAGRCGHDRVLGARARACCRIVISTAFLPAHARREARSC
jgi:L-glyceraldehyde 3-phosphate reductase